MSTSWTFSTMVESFNVKDTTVEILEASTNSGDKQAEFGSGTTLKEAVTAISNQTSYTITMPFPESLTELPAKANETSTIELIYSGENGSATSLDIPNATTSQPAIEEKQTIYTSAQTGIFMTDHTVETSTTLIPSEETTAREVADGSAPSSAFSDPPTQGTIGNNSNTITIGASGDFTKQPRVGTISSDSNTIGGSSDITDRPTESTIKNDSNTITIGGSGEFTNRPTESTISGETSGDFTNQPTESTIRNAPNNITIGGSGEFTNRPSDGPIRNATNTFKTTTLGDFTDEATDGTSSSISGSISSVTVADDTSRPTEDTISSAGGNTSSSTSQGSTFSPIESTTNGASKGMSSTASNELTFQPTKNTTSSARNTTNIISSTPTYFETDVSAKTRFSMTSETNAVGTSLDSSTTMNALQPGFLSSALHRSLVIAVPSASIALLVFILLVIYCRKKKKKKLRLKQARELWFVRPEDNNVEMIGMKATNGTSTDSLDKTMPRANIGQPASVNIFATEDEADTNSPKGYLSKHSTRTSVNSRGLTRSLKSSSSSNEPASMFKKSKTSFSKMDSGVKRDGYIRSVSELNEASDNEQDDNLSMNSVFTDNINSPKMGTFMPIEESPEKTTATVSRADSVAPSTEKTSF